jgi:hypothetical protein
MLLDFLKGNHFKMATTSMPGLWGVKELAQTKCPVLGQGIGVPGLCGAPGDSVLWVPASGQAGRLIQSFNFSLHQGRSH